MVGETPHDEVALAPALEIGGTHVTSVLVDLAAARVVPGSVHRQALPGDGAADELLGGLIRCAEMIRLPAPAHWGVAVPGPFDYRRGVARFESVGKLDSLRGVDVGAALRRGLPRMIASTSFLNDADAFGLGEFVAGAAAGHGRAAAITLGSGVGSCFLDHGAVVDAGPTVPPDGRADLLTWEGRALEETVSRRGIRARYAERTGAPTQAMPDVLEIAGRARAGDAAAREVFEHALEILGRVLGPWIVRFGASVLVVGGSISASWDLIEPPLRRGLMVAGPVTAGLLAPASNPTDAGLIGAACHARRTFSYPEA
jgi:glucokinase